MRFKRIAALIAITVAIGLSFTWTCPVSADDQTDADTLKGKILSLFQKHGLVDNQRQLSGPVKTCESIFEMYQALIPDRVCDYGSLEIDAYEVGELPGYYTNYIECLANATQGEWQVTDLKANQKADPNTGREITTVGFANKGKTYSKTFNKSEDFFFFIESFNWLYDEYQESPNTFIINNTNEYFMAVHLPKTLVADLKTLLESDDISDYFFE